MYCEIHYKASGVELVTKVKTMDEKKEAVAWCKEHGFEILKNSMCLKCKRHGKSCDGTDNFVWNGCVYREVLR